VRGSVNRASLAVAATYDVKVTVGYANRTLAAVSNMRVTNNSRGPIDRLELNTVTARIGRLRLGQVTVDGRAVTPTVVDQTVTVPLGGVLPHGASANVRIPFTATFGLSATDPNWYFTRYNGTINAYRWLPWISRPTRFDRPNRGAPFVTATSRSVRVAITTDRPIGIATSGRRVAVSGRTQTFVASDVRDFNFAASPHYRTMSDWVGTTRVTLFYRPGAPASMMLARARWALSRLNSLVGPYPYPTFTVAQAAGGYAMESPGQIWLPDVDTSRLTFQITHETAHQWFYAMVGNDQAREPFADEGPTEFLARYLLGAFRSSRCASNRLDLTIYAYSRGCFYEVVYVKGANVLNQVKAKMGNSAFWTALRDYAKTYRNRISGTRTLLRFLDERTSADLRPLYRIYFPSLDPS
jgi:hypothetical protein